MEKKDMLTVLFLIGVVGLIALATGGVGLYVGNALYGNNVLIKTIEHNNTIYRNITTVKTCNDTVLVREIVREVYPSTTYTIPTPQTTTSTLFKRISSAAMFNLYNRNQMEVHNEKCYMNYTITYDRKFISGVTQAFDRFDCDNMSEYIYGYVEDWTESKGVHRMVISAYVNWTNGTYERLYP